MNYTLFVLILAIAVVHITANWPEDLECEYVDRVIDGDTIVVNGAPLRLKNIDAPEMGTRAGLQAKWGAQELLDGCVKIERYGRGYYGRRLIEIEIDGLDFETAMVNNGYAVWYK